MAKIGRNQPCPCGSGKKYKKCYGDSVSPVSLPKTQAYMTRAQVNNEVKKTLRRHEARELVRVEQQGEGRPIISAVVRDHRLVAVGRTVHYSKEWKFFPDFLSHYLKLVMDPEWGNMELRKEFEERHPILRWYHDYCLWQQECEQRHDGMSSGIATGVVYCYLGLAYGLYLLNHNVELQDRLVKRLKDSRNFQGAYYEVIVSSCLIRAGFELALEDETDETEKHCEFSATSKKTRKKYWVEAKMRSVRGMLGKTKLDGSPATGKPDAQVTKHLREALEKPAQDERLVFIDVNTSGPSPEDIRNQNVPRWLERSRGRLEARERERKEGDKAYVFVTNFPFHWHLKDEAPTIMGLTYGLGMQDFGKEREYRFSEMWKMKQKHVDAYNLVGAVKSYPQIPTTFDGDLPLSREDMRNRVEVGERYFFPDIGGKGIVGDVTAATVSEQGKKMCLTIASLDGRTHFVEREMSDEELDVYRTHREGFFGVRQGHGIQIDGPYECFEWLMDSYKNTSREKLLELSRGHSNYCQLAKLDDTDIRLALCESWTAGFYSSGRAEAD